MSIFRNLFGSKDKRETRKEEKRQPDEVEVLITTLQDSNQYGYNRLAAAEALGRVKDVRAIEPLISALKVASMQKEIAKSLAEIGAPAVEPLITVLNDSNSEVRLGAVMALGLIRDTLAVEPLITALNDSDTGVRRGAAYALGLINDTRAVEPLITALKDSETEVRYFVTWALGEIKDVRAIKPLINAFRDEFEDVRMGAAGSLGEIGSPAVEPLITSLKDSNAKVRMGAVLALGEIKDVRSVEPLITALKDSDMDIQSKAAKALIRIGALSDDQAAEVQRIKGSQVETLMKRFVDAGLELEKIAFARFGKHGFSELGTTNDSSKLKESGQALQDSGTAAVDPLCNFLENYNVGGFDLTFACKEAIIVLGNLGDKKAIPAIEKFVSNHSYAEDVAQEAIQEIRRKLP